MIKDRILYGKIFCWVWLITIGSRCAESKIEISSTPSLHLSKLLTRSYMEIQMNDPQGSNQLCLNVTNRNLSSPCQSKESGSLWLVSKEDKDGYVRFTTKFLGEQKCLDAQSREVESGYMSDCREKSPGTFWKIITDQKGGPYYLTNKSHGEKKCLNFTVLKTEEKPDELPSLSERVMTNCSENPKGSLWKFVSTKETEEETYFRLKNNHLGKSYCLNTKKNSSGKSIPFMTDCQDQNLGSFWIAVVEDNIRAEEGYIRLKNKLPGSRMCLNISENQAYQGEHSISMRDCKFKYRGSYWRFSGESTESLRLKNMIFCDESLSISTCMKIEKTSVAVQSSRWRIKKRSEKHRVRSVTDVQYQYEDLNLDGFFQLTNKLNGDNECLENPSTFPFMIPCDSPIRKKSLWKRIENSPMITNGEKILCMEQDNDSNPDEVRIRKCDKSDENSFWKIVYTGKKQEKCLASDNESDDPHRAFMSYCHKNKDGSFWQVVLEEPDHL